MLRKAHARFLGGRTRVTVPGYPTPHKAEMLELAQGQVTKCCGHYGGWSSETACVGVWPTAEVDSRCEWRPAASLPGLFWSGLSYSDDTHSCIHH